MMPRAALLTLALVLAGPAYADDCDGLTVRMIRATGASLAGRAGPLVVFRAADAERMSLACARPREMLFRTQEREPPRAYFILIGLAGHALAGAGAQDVETLSLNLHQAALLTGLPQSGAAGGLVARCEAGDRPDGSYAGTLCTISDRATAPLRRRAGLSAGRRPG